MFPFLQVVVFWTLVFLPQGILCTISKRGDVSIATTFYFDSSCSQAQQAVIEQAQKDARLLAGAALDDVKELLTVSASKNGKTINFRTKAAIDFFGPSKTNAPNQQYIVNTFWRATQAKPGLGWSDWWHNRYVYISCSGRKGDCERENVFAFTGRGSGILYQYPEIHYCDPYFKNLTSHGEMVKKIEEDGSGQRKLNALSMQSQATTTLHEWLHIAGYSSEICGNGCFDIAQKIGGVNYKTLEPGPAKLLAQRNPFHAGRTNDNYVYYAVSRFMRKKFGQNPKYPLAWLPDRSIRENVEKEAREPGYPRGHVVPAPDESSSETLVTDARKPVSDYPDWYKPLIEHAGDDTAPVGTEPPEEPVQVAEPDEDLVKCTTEPPSPSEPLPDFQDCVHAFGALNSFADLPAQHGKKGEVWWAGYVQSCAIAVQYVEDWKAECKATLNDIKGHAGAIFKGCQTQNTVAGEVAFKTPGCPATIKILRTAKK